MLPVVLFITPATAPILLLLPALWLVRKVGYGRFVPATPLDGAMLLLLLMLLVSSYVTFDLAFSLQKIAGVAFGVAVYYATVTAARRSRRHLLAGVALFLGSGLAVAGLGLLGTQWSNKLPGLGAVTVLLPPRLLALPGAAGGFNPNQVAGTLLWLAPLALAIALALLLHPPAGVRPWPRLAIALALLVSWGVALILTGVLLLSQSRSGLLGLTAAVAFVLLASAWLRSRRLPAAALLLLLLTTAGAAYAHRLGYLAPWPPAATLAAVDNDAALAGSLDVRLEVWSRAIYGIQDFPITGLGIGAFRHVVHVLYPLFLFSPAADVAHAHNHLLQTGLDLGILGLIAYLALWLGAAAMLWQTWQRATALWARTLVIGFGGALLGYFIYGLTDAVALGARPGFLFWWLLGLAAALHRLVREKAEGRRQKREF